MKTARHLVALLLLLALTGCGASTESDAGGDALRADQDAPAPAAVARDAAAAEGAEQAYDEQAAPRTEVSKAALIQRGTVTAEAKDVHRARLAAQSVATRYDGEVTASETASDADGEATFAHLVLRVPSASFARAMADLEKIGTLRDSTTDTEDVTTQVKDVDARVKVQRASIDRIRSLLSAARDIGDVVRIESELSSREAALDSLLQQQAHLADQTSRSTIAVDISRVGEGPSPDRGGFLGGLERGWDGLVGFTSGALLVVGVLVPWLPLIALAVALVWWGARRLRPRRVDAPLEA